MELRRIETKGKDGESNGWIIPIYRDYDEFFRDYRIRFVYASAVAAQASKGPHVHHKRQCMLVPLSGRVTVVKRVDGEYINCELDAGKPAVCHIPTHVPFKVVNDDDSEAIILNLADHAWHPDDQDSPTVDDWRDE